MVWGNHLIITVLITSCFSTPVEYGASVGNIREFPYVVHLSITKEDVRTHELRTGGCGGTLLKPGVVLTAGHCLYHENYIINKIEITAGSVHRGNEDDEIQGRLAKGFRIHHKFQRERKNILSANQLLPFDIAIVWLRRPFPVQANSNIQTARLSDRDIKAGMIGNVLGWGQLETGFAAKTLKRTDLRKISDFDCKKKYNYENGPNTFCVISLDQKCGISIGDSGGPFIYQGLFAGIVSYGKTKPVNEKNRKIACDTSKPVVLTDIRMYNEWNEKNLKVGTPKEMCFKDQQKYCAL